MEYLCIVRTILCPKRIVLLINMAEMAPTGSAIRPAAKACLFFYGDGPKVYCQYMYRVVSLDPIMTADIRATKDSGP